MPHLPHLMTDLALILISAGIMTLIFKWLKQPLVLGYIVAGLLAGPYFDLLPTVTYLADINIWAEIGVVFLLFSLGLEFSFKKLMHVGGTAFIAAMTEIITMLFVGFAVGTLLGWSPMNGIFLGGMLSMSSTTIIIKAFDDLNLRKQKFTGIVFGVLVVEDLAAIIMMVILSTLAVSSQFGGEAMLGSILKVVFFLILWFLIGIFLLPTFLKKVKKLMNDETLLIISLGLCLGMVVVATQTGFSAALGAFIMGSILAETVEAEHIEHIVTPVKNLFGAVFFVSVGMMVDPAILAEYIVPVVIITLTALFGKAFFSSLGVLLSGQQLKVSVQSGFSLAQIGEFAFIIAALGVSLNVLDVFVYPVIVAVSVVTTFTTPYMIQLSGPFADWLYRILPAPFVIFLDHYASGNKTVNRETEWKKLLKQYMVNILMISVVLTGIILLSFRGIDPALSGMLAGAWGKLLTAFITLLLMAPFVRALILNKSNSPELFDRLWRDARYNKGRLVSLVLFRIFLAILFVSIVVIGLFPTAGYVGVIIALPLVALIFLLRTLFNQYPRIEEYFLVNFNIREVEKRKKTPLRNIFKSILENKNIHLSSVVVSPNSPYIGKTLAELDLRNKCGISIVKIYRGCRQINIPDSKEHLYPYDKLVVVGTDDQLALFVSEAEPAQDINPDTTQEVTLFSFIVEPGSSLIGCDISTAGFAKVNCLLVGVERGKVAMMSPPKSIVFQEGDLVWVAGEKDNILKLLS